MAGVAAAALVIVAMGMIDIVFDGPATVTLVGFLAGLLLGGVDPESRPDAT